MKRTANHALVTVALLVGVRAFVIPHAAHAALTPAQKCTVAKQKAAGKKAAGKITCHTKVKLAAAADPACLQKAEDKFDKAFVKAEKPGACQVIGDAASVEGQVDTFVSALVQALNPGQALQARATTTPAQKCAIAKAKAASKKATAKLTCQIKNLSLPSAQLLNLCFSTAEDKFDTAFTNAEKPGACAATGDAAAIESLVDVFVSGIVAGPPTPTPTFGPTPTPKPCTSGFVDNGNGTITDCSTKLMWEKKDGSGGARDVSNTYQWAGTCTISGTLCQEDAQAEALCNAQTGGAVGCAQCGPGQGVCDLDTSIWSWLAFDVEGIADHNDWRIPTLAELQTILASPCPGGGLPCVPLEFRSPCTPGCSAIGATPCSCTVPGLYWSATTNLAGNPSFAWVVAFGSGGAGTDNKTLGDYVRAVRGGS